MLRHRIAAAVASALALGSFAVASPAGALAGCEGIGQFVFDSAGHPVITNQVGDAGCVVTLHDGASSRFVAAYTEPGWTYSVKSDGGTGSSSRVVVEFRNASTGGKWTYKIEAGRARIA